MSKIKVGFHVTTLFFGGIEKVLLTYLQNFDRSEYDLTLIISFAMGEQLELLKSEIPKDVKIEYIVKSKLLNNIKIKKKIGVYYSKTERALNNIILKPISNVVHFFNFYRLSFQYDVIIDFDLCSNNLKSRAPIISVLHFNLSSQITSLKSKAIIQNRFRIANRIIVLNEEMKCECVSVFPEFMDKYCVVYNPFDLDKINNLSQQYNNVTIKDNYVLTVCRLEESQKDVTTLIKSFKKLIEKYNYSGSLVILGDGKSRNNLENLAINLEVSDRVKFLGLQNNPYTYMAKAELFVLSSKFEGLPSVLIEAMACNVPIVSSRCPTGIIDILDNGNCGILVNVGDVDGLTDAMNSVITNEDLRQELLNNSLSQIDKFSIENNLYKFYELINLSLKKLDK